MGEYIIKHGLTAQLVRDYPEVMTQDMQKLQRNVQIFRALEQRENMQKAVKLKEVIPTLEEHFQYLFKNSHDMTKKKSHIWAYGPTNSGKTYFVQQLIKAGVQVFQGPFNNDWFGFD